MIWTQLIAKIFSISEDPGTTYKTSIFDHCLSFEWEICIIVMLEIRVFVLLHDWRTIYLCNLNQLRVIQLILEIHTRLHFCYVTQIFFHGRYAASHISVMSPSHCSRVMQQRPYFCDVTELLFNDDTHQAVFIMSSRCSSMVLHNWSYLCDA